ncbi:hypothetical protein O181_038651 [Austropuccinia psidii MF-1]|uniref:Retrovirus-related Pol polyprotein from transposon TNT 1-94-like beta-barrel domain-containing protein n=1 Tax=Austropuccinia psidii MF-1 TaxID=1389203 RepID=A0A9Q3DEE1_9BASI|nr:hypothetical protein [Austropuccinia psidii MF-1]
MGASNHMFNNKSFFENLHPNHHTKVTTGCRKSSLTSQGMGLEKIVYCLGNLWLLPNSLHVPNLTTSSLALSSIAKNEMRIKRATSHFKVYLDSNDKPYSICPVTSGYKNEASIYCILRVSAQKILISKHVLFDENKFPSLTSQKKFTEDVARKFSTLSQTTEEGSERNSNTEYSSLRIESSSLDNESEEIFFNSLEQQPKQI